MKKQPNRLLFPENNRSFAGKRTVKICLRTLHLVGVTGLGGAYLYSAPHADWAPYFHTTMYSGIVLTLLEIWSNGIWLIQLRGLSIMVKLIPLAIIIHLGIFQGPLLLLIVVISGLIAHAPGDIRYHSIFHGKRIDAFTQED